MAAKTDPINTTNPAGDSDPKQGDNYIRTLAKSLIELLTVDHYVGAANPWGSDASGDETGEHVKVTFHEAISDPTVAAGDGVLYIKGDPPELYFRDEDDGNVTQFTSGGEILFGSLSSIAKDTYLKAINDAGDGTIDLIKGNASDKPVIKAGAELSTSGDPGEDAGIACKKYVDDEITANAKAFGSRVSKNINTVYQADTDGFISFNTQMGNQGNVYLYSDGSSPPTTEIAHIHGDWGNGHIPCCKPIKKDDYYKITYAGAGTVDLIFWQPVS